jgi:hypothetical protein
MDNFMAFMVTMRVLELGASIITAGSLLAIAWYEVGIARARKRRGYRQ